VPVPVVGDYEVSLVRVRVMVMIAVMGRVRVKIKLKIGPEATYSEVKELVLSF
jgi:hypothetical protein